MPIPKARVRSFWWSCQLGSQRLATNVLLEKRLSSSNDLFGDDFNLAEGGELVPSGVSIRVSISIPYKHVLKLNKVLHLKIKLFRQKRSVFTGFRKVWGHISFLDGRFFDVGNTTTTTTTINKRSGELFARTKTLKAGGRWFIQSSANVTYLEVGIYSGQRGPEVRPKRSSKTHRSSRRFRFTLLKSH